MDDLKVSWPTSEGKLLVTHSMIQCFLGCRRKCLYRYGFGLRLPKKDEGPALHIGGIVHKLLEEYHNPSCNLAGADTMTMQCHAAAMIEEPVGKDEAYYMARAAAMMEVYATLRPRTWGIESKVEVGVEGPILSPYTGHPSHKVRFAGKIDHLLRTDDGWWLTDHKTTQEVDATAIKRAWSGSQHQRYMLFCQEKIVGAIINYLGKGYTDRRIGESDEQFATRKRQAEAEGKNPNRMRQKTFSSPKEMYEGTLNTLSKNPGRFFHQEKLIITKSSMDDTRRELWDFVQEFLHTIRFERWSKNTNACFNFNRTCEYFDICMVNNGSKVDPYALNMFQVVHGHTELATENEELPF